ncbi:drug resistance protein [Apiospora kogelbergensis]|uniref:Drug resistance protein n=1 Tax=Apiospora kogelbergensis TaxID=1337665 RepID=A0AAW0R108_9PEZI
MAASAHDIDVERLAHHEVEPPQDESREAAVEEEKRNAFGETASPPSHVAVKMSLLHECLFIAAMCAAQFTTQVGLTQALGIVDQIGNSFGVTNPGVRSWFIAGYSLTAGTFILVAGRVGDLFGYKRVFVLGMLWFALWSMVAGLRAGPGGVAAQCAGPAGSDLPPGLRKNMAFALFGACAPGGGVFGFVFGGLFELAWWPWTFWSFAIALAFLAGLSALVIPSQSRSPDQDKAMGEKLQMLDIPGAVTGVAALVLFNFAWNQGAAYGWQEPYIGVCLALGVISAVCFFFIESRWAKTPLVPFKVFTGDITFVVACIACGWACFGIWVFYTSQFIQVLRGASPMLLAAYICPVAISGAFASLATGFLLQHVRAAWVMTFSLTCFMVGTILSATAPVGQTYWAQLFVCMLIIPFGMDTSFPAATVTFSNAVAREHQGMGAALVATVVNYSISLGLGFAGTIEVNINHGGTTPADVLLGFRGALYFGIGLTGLGILLSLLFVAKGYWKDKKAEQSLGEDC